MSDLGELYQEVILDHNRNPRNFRVIEEANRTAEGYNPLCGDRLQVYLRVRGEVIEEVSFGGEGCAISKASASVMTTALAGKTRAEAEALFARFKKMVTGQEAAEIEDLGELAALSGVSEFPTRVKCATLCWHALVAALDREDEPVTTE